MITYNLEDIIQSSSCSVILSSFIVCYATYCSALSASVNFVPLLSFPALPRYFKKCPYRYFTSLGVLALFNNDRNPGKIISYKS